jgi:hypothetical protein
MTAKEVFDAICDEDAWPHEDAFRREPGFSFWFKTCDRYHISVLHYDVGHRDLGLRLKILMDGKRFDMLAGAEGPSGRFENYRWDGDEPTIADLVELKLIMGDEFATL